MLSTDKSQSATFVDDDDVRDMPVLNGKIYCSPRCGCKCTKAAFDRATKEANALAARMGDGWAPEVWENCGWHYTVAKGEMTIHIMHGRKRHKDGGFVAESYWASFKPASIEHGNHTQAISLTADADTPEDAVGFVTQDARSLIQRITEALAAVSA
tara:strand:- start:1458 stop:1925 length:468 start_codon:yes stop_codon:yes gene_type:complete